MTRTLRGFICLAAGLLTSLNALADRELMIY